MSEASSSKNEDGKSSKSSKKSSKSKSSQNESVNQSQKSDNKTENLPEQITSTRAYLESTVTSVVQEGMLELAKTRPDNPLEFLGNFILNKAKEK